MSDAVMAHDQCFIFLAAVLGRVAFIEDSLVKHRQHEANTYGVHSVPRWRRLISRFSHDPEWDRLAAIAAHSRAGVARAIDRNRPDCDGSLAAIADGYRTLGKRHERRLQTYILPSLTGRVAALSRAVQERDYSGRPWGLEPKAIARDAVRGALLRIKMNRCDDKALPPITFILSGYNQSDLIDAAIAGALGRTIPISRSS